MLKKKWVTVSLATMALLGVVSSAAASGFQISNAPSSITSTATASSFSISR
ncbi:hypothetical protein [Cohnella soli]|uniref:Uncharacterized protein n=1 Tax=Cohnella soli TaxID=425005 RepID=A0ABW0I165_9BACL